MRRLLVTILSLVATRVVLTMVKKASKSRVMEQKLEELQEKFRSLDAVSQ